MIYRAFLLSTVLLFSLLVIASTLSIRPHPGHPQSHFRSPFFENVDQAKPKPKEYAHSVKSPEADAPIISEEDVRAVKSEDAPVIAEEDADSEPRRSYMSVRIISTSGRMCVSCWSGDHDKDRNGCSSSPSDIKVLSWDFNSGAATKFWCDATWGSKYLSRFPVFGDGVPKKSSEWKVDHQGKRRTHENGNVVNDYFRSWTTS